MAKAARKRKKRATATRLPDKRRLKTIADRIWSEAVKADWAGKCAVCGTRSNIQAHHLIFKSGVNAHRYTLRNGMALCASHHMGSYQCSPHNGPVGFGAWMARNHPSIVEWCENNKWAKTVESVSQRWYLDHIIRLREYIDEREFDRICGSSLVAYIANSLD